MIQDRLTAKFQSAKPVQRQAKKSVVPAKKTKASRPALVAYTKGRTLPGSFWL